MESLKRFNESDLYKKLLLLSEDEFNEWLKDLGLLHQKRTCECGAPMRLKNREDGRKFPSWHCRRKTSGKVCGKARGYVVGTFFEGTHLSLKEIFQLSYYFARQAHPQEEIQFNLRREDGSTISEEAIVDYKNFFREVCQRYFERHPVIIGGPGKVVEIDETVITKRKYHRGQLRAQEQWFFGGVERGSSENCFLVPVDKRDADTLLPIIMKHIRKGSTIISDGWAAYGRIKEILMTDSGERAYAGHFVVNHSENFVDPETGAHTQTIEGTWSHFKARHKKERGTSRGLFASYLYQFMWRKKFSGDDALYHLWQQIAEQYPCEMEEEEPTVVGEP